MNLTISSPPVLPGPGEVKTALRLSDLSLFPARFRRGTRILFTLSQAARVDFTVHRARPKRRWAKIGVFSREGKSGANSLKWRGRIGKSALRPGRYRLTAQASSGNGTISEPLRKRFKILPR